MSLLQSSTPDQVVAEPFPHLVIEEALPLQACRELVRAFPPFDEYFGDSRLGSNVKQHLHAQRALADPRIASIWKALIDSHLRPEFVADVMRLFGPSIRAVYPDFDARYGPLETLRVGRRGQGDFHDFEMRLDAELTVHAPVQGAPSLERGPHLKLRHKLFFGILLLRAEEDQTQGGDMELFSLRPGIRPEYGPRQVIDESLVKLERCIPYRAGTFVMCLNTPWAVQNFSLRWPGNSPLQYLVIHGDVREPLYEIPLRADAQPPVLRRWSRGLRRWLKQRTGLALAR
jgi:hypothetical protein